MTNRRDFIARITVASGIAMTTNASFAQAPAVAETDANAIALGYKIDTAKVDKKKFPKHEVTQNCKNCALYQGKPTDPVGGCPLFAAKQVAGNGWCSAWAKRA